MGNWQQCFIRVNNVAQLTIQSINLCLLAACQNTGQQCTISKTHNSSEFKSYVPNICLCTVLQYYNTFSYSFNDGVRSLVSVSVTFAFYRLDIYRTRWFIHFIWEQTLVSPNALVEKGLRAIVIHAKGHTRTPEHGTILVPTMWRRFSGTCFMG